MISILLTVNVIICIALIILILLQRSDPASGGMFGGAGGGGGATIRNPLARPTALLAAAFLILSLVLAYLNKGGSDVGSVMATTPVEGTLPTQVSATLPGPSLLPTAVSETATVTTTQP